jgi:hypothetical protein
VFAVTMPELADAHYAGKGVGRGEPGRPIFWYKTDDGGRYRVIYADLTVKEAGSAPEVAGAVRIGLGVFGVPKTHETPDQQTASSVMARLKSLRLAMDKYAEVYNRYPPAAIRGKDGAPLLSWRVKLLPYLGHEELYKQFNLDEPWDSEHNKPLVEKMPSFYSSPRVGDLGGRTVYLIPTGSETFSADPEGAKAKEIAGSGSRHAILIVEADAEHAVPWTKPEDLEIDPENPAAGLRLDGGSFIVARADGSVGRLPADMGPARLWSLFTRPGGGTTERHK